MITSAAVKLRRNFTGEELIIPCHRHGDVYSIIMSLGFKLSDFTTLEQGFIWSEPDETEWEFTDCFVNRKRALELARECGQVKETLNDKELYSEDLW